MTQQDFLKGIDNQCNHRVLLWEALKLTAGKVVEFGSGHGSTPFLRQFCEETQRPFESYESNAVWAEMTGATLIDDWAELPSFECDVLFLDHAPGERRQFDLQKFANLAKIIVIHDSEPTGGGDYRVRQHFEKFLHKVEVKTSGAWATMISNHIPLDGCVGQVNETYSIEL